MNEKVDVSLVIPFYNEESNIQGLFEDIFAALPEIPKTFEVIAVDDGSQDATLAQLQQVEQNFSLPENLKRLILVVQRRNFGQTPAMVAGIDQAHSEVIITLDGDRQNDPADFAPLLVQMDEGFDVVSGWRKDRQDQLSKKIPSRLANSILARVTGVPLHDFGCTLKAYRTELLQEAKLYGENHRYIPALLKQMGARIGEIPTHHRARTAGASKYGISRVYRVVLDILLLKFLLSYSTRPIHYFGSWGMVSLGAGFILCLYLTGLKLLGGAHIADRPLLLLGILLIIVGVQTLFLGILAELLIRTYFEANDKKIYYTKEVIRIDNPDKEK